MSKQEVEAAVEADLASTHPDMRPCKHCGKPERDHSYLGHYCLPPTAISAKRVMEGYVRTRNRLSCTESYWRPGEV